MLSDMSIQSNNTGPRLAASQVGAIGNLLRQRNEARFGAENNNNRNASTGGKEGIVQKLQEVLFAVRRDRDREHRSRDIAMEKLRSAKEVFQAEKSNFESEQEKLTKTRNEAERTQMEILQREESIRQLQQKYRFQHEDLIRKREKIQQQNSSLEAASFERNKSVLDVRRRLDHQRNMYQKLKRMEDQESENLLSKIVSLAGGKNLHDASAAAVNTTQSENRIAEETVDRKKSRSNATHLDGFLEALEKKQEEAMAREFKTNIDYDMLPKMISDKSQALKAENETIRAEITRLKSMSHGTANTNYPQQKEPRFETGDNLASSASSTTTVDNKVDGSNVEGAPDTSENAMVCENIH